MTSDDPFKPASGDAFTNGEVNRGGQDILHFSRTVFPHDLKSHEEVDDWALAHGFAAVTWWRSLHAYPLSKVAANLRYHVARETALVDGRIDVTQRLKRLPSIFDKLDREPTMQVTQMQDIGGVRARLPSLRHVYAVSRRLKKTWTIHRTRDYISDPKPSGYRALHHIVRRDGVKVEVQLRTTLQDAWANQVEDDGRQTEMGFKFGRGDVKVHDYYRAMSEAFALMNLDRPLPPDLVQAIQTRYASIRGVLPREQAPRR